MHRIGRYTRMRAVTLPFGDVSAPLILARRRAQWTPEVYPAGGPEWEWTPKGLWRQVRHVLADEAGMAGFRGGVNTGTGFHVGMETIDNMGGGSSLTSIALSSAYASASTGNAVGTRYLCTRSNTLTDLYFWITSYTGTASSVTDIDWEVRSGTETAPTTGGGGLLTSNAVNPSSATGWIHVSGISQALTAGNYYYFIIADANGNGTNFANVAERGGQAWTGGNANHALFNSAVRTTNGFSTTSRDSSAGKIIAVFDDGTVVGNPITNTELSTNNAEHKGLYIDALTEQIKFLGFAYDVNSTIDIYVWEGATGPSGSPAASGTLANSLGATNWRGIFLSTAYTLQKATVYRIVGRSASNHQVPRRAVIGTGVDSTIMKAFWGQGAWYWAQANSTTDWANDVTTKFPCMSLYFEDSVAITSGVPVPGVAHYGGIKTGGRM